MYSRRLNRSAVSAGISGLIVIVIVAVVFATYVGFTFSQSVDTTTVPFPVTTVNESSTASYQTSVDYQIPTQSASDTNSTLGLALQLELAPSNGSIGTLVIIADILNILNVQNNVTHANQWHYSSNSLNPFNPCGAPGPVGFAVLQGYYDQSNYSSGSALMFYNSTVTYLCTTRILPTGYYSFIPHSHTALLVDSKGQSFYNQSIAISFSVNGYFTEGGSFLKFPEGQYTVVAADEWGELVILHFVVTQEISYTNQGIHGNNSYPSVCSSITTSILNYTSILTVTECKVT